MDPDETGNHKNLLIVFHTQGVKNERMAQAVFEGATDDSIGGVFVRMRRALDADAEDLLWADGVIFGTPENFGYMSGALKDFFDRTFYPCEGKTEGLPFAIFIGCGNDGTGALNAIRRITPGYRFRVVAEPVIVRGELDEVGLEGARDRVEFFQSDACNLKPLYTDYDLVFAGNLIDRLSRGEVIDFLDVYVAPSRLADWLVARYG